MSELFRILREDNFGELRRRMRLSQVELDAALPQSIMLRARNCSRLLVDNGADIFRLHEGKTML